MKVEKQIEQAIEVWAKKNPHFGVEQLMDMVFFQVFGAWNGTETDKRNMALIRWLLIKSCI